MSGIVPGVRVRALGFACPGVEEATREARWPAENHVGRATVSVFFDRGAQAEHDKGELVVPEVRVGALGHQRHFELALESLDEAVGLRVVRRCHGMLGAQEART